MREELVESTLCCPVDRAFPFEVRGERGGGGEIEEGELACPKCGAVYPIRAGIPVLFPPNTVEEANVARAKERESHARDADAEGYDRTVPAVQTAIEVAALLDGVGIEEGDRVLDLGAGTGRLTVELARRHAVVLACDLSPRSLEVSAGRCRAIPGATVHHLAVDACYLPIRDGLADKAVSGMMLEHLPTDAERARCLDEVRRALRPGGELALTVYNYSLRKRRHWPREGYHAGDLYYRNLDEPELRRLLAGYRVSTVTGLMNLPQRWSSPALEEFITKVPALAVLTGDLLLAVARRAGVETS